MSIILFVAQQSQVSQTQQSSLTSGVIPYIARASIIICLIIFLFHLEVFSSSNPCESPNKFLLFKTLVSLLILVQMTSNITALLSAVLLLFVKLRYPLSSVNLFEMIKLVMTGDEAQSDEDSLLGKIKTLLLVILSGLALHFSAIVVTSIILDLFYSTLKFILIVVLLIIVALFVAHKMDLLAKLNALLPQNIQKHLTRIKKQTSKILESRLHDLELKLS